MNRIKELRKQKKLTQKQLANELGCGLTTITNWEQGVFPPDAKNRKKLCTLFNITEAELFEDSKKESLIEEKRRLEAKIKLLEAQSTLPPEILEAFKDDNIREALQDPKVLKLIALLGKGKKETRDVVKDLLEKIPELDLEKLQMILTLAKPTLA